MNKFLTNQFSKGPNNSLYLSDRSNFAFRGKWIGVQYKTIMDKWHLGDSMPITTPEFGSNEAETMNECLARPMDSNIWAFSINQSLT